MQLLSLNKKLDYYRFFSRKFVYFGIIGVLWSKIAIFTINPTHFSSLSWNLRTKMTYSQKCRIWKFTLVLIELQSGEFSNSFFLTESHFWSQIRAQWWKLSWINGKYCDFWSQNSNYSKINEFMPKKSIIIQFLIQW